MAIHKIDGVDAVDGGSAINSFPKKFVTLHGTAAITKGDWVVIDLANTENGRGASVKKFAGGGSLDATTFGVATETISAAGVIRIQTAGLCEFALLTASVAAGAALACDGSTAGAASAAAGGDAAAPCGIYISDDGSTGSVAAASNRVLIADQGYF